MTVLITGASGDIGLAIADALQTQPGVRLFLQHHSADPAFAAAFPGATALRCDLREEAQAEALFANIEAQAGPVDVLVNNCGFSGFSLFQDISTADWRNMLAVNLDAAFFCCRRALPPMIRAGDGSIVNIASMWGQVGASCEAHYSAAKGGLIAMTKALAKEVAPSGIRVNCVSPGLIQTKMNSRLSPQELADFCGDIPMGRAGTADEVAAAVRFLALEGGYITGQVLGVNGGYIS